MKSYVIIVFSANALVVNRLIGLKPFSKSYWLFLLILMTVGLMKWSRTGNKVLLLYAACVFLLAGLLDLIFEVSY